MQLGEVISACRNAGEEELVELRRALLEVEWEKTRIRGERRLERIASRRDPETSPLAVAGLASSAVRSMDFSAAIRWGSLAVRLYPMTPSAVFCSTLLISVFRSLGMRRERFAAERERFHILRRMAFHTQDRMSRIYALNELLQELKARDLSADAQKCSEELEDLLAS